MIGPHAYILRIGFLHRTIVEKKDMAHKPPDEMSHGIYRDYLAHFGQTQIGFGAILGLSRRTAQNYATDGVPSVVAFLVRLIAGLNISPSTARSIADRQSLLEEGGGHVLPFAVGAGRAPRKPRGQADEDEIRRLYLSGMRQMAIATKFNVSQGYISRIVTGLRRQGRAGAEKNQTAAE